MTSIITKKATNLLGGAIAKAWIGIIHEEEGVSGGFNYLPDGPALIRLGNGWTLWKDIELLDHPSYGSGHSLVLLCFEVTEIDALWYLGLPKPHKKI